MLTNIYFDTWASKWTDKPDQMDLANIKYVDVVNLSFVNPLTNYKLGQKTFDGTGLDFSQSFDCVYKAIQILRGNHVKVMLSVGGASYSDWSKWNPLSIWSLKKDLGVDGIDVDWEGVEKDSQQLVDIVGKMVPFKGYLSVALNAAGAFPKGNDEYAGMAIKLLKQYSYGLSWINLMLYDCGKSFDVYKAFSSFREIYTGRIYFGMEIGKQGWGDALLTQDEVNKDLQFLNNQVNCGVMVWAYFSQGNPDAKWVLDRAKKYK